MNATQCHKCGGNMSQVRERATFNVGQRTAEVVVERFRCAGCGEILYSPEQMDAAQSAVAAALRKQDGLLTPVEIKKIREKYRLSQAHLEQLLGVGPKTVVRWERGTVFQNRTTDELLRIIAKFPEVCAHLARKNGVSIQLPGVKGPLPHIPHVKVSAVRDRIVSPVPLLSSDSDWHPNFNRYSLPRRRAHVFGGGDVFPVRRAQQRPIALEMEVALPAIPLEELR